MALFKIKKGVKANLPTSYVEGYCYFTTDDGKFYIDTSDAASGRICLNAGAADKLTSNAGSATQPVYFSGGKPVATTGILSVNLNNADSGTAPFTNSDMLGGLPASSYLQVADFPQALTDAGVVKSVAGKTPNASGEVALVPADIGAAASSHTHNYVPTSRTINDKALSGNISLTYSDVGAAAANHTHNYVPTSREINGKALSSNISLTYSDVGAAAASHSHTIYSLQSIGTNPITSTADDTSTNWGNRGTCVCFYSTAGCLIDQPSQYGILVSFSQGTEVHQIWMIQPSGKVYHRGANASGWSGTWKNMVDASCFSLSGTTLTITTT